MMINSFPGFRRILPFLALTVMTLQSMQAQTPGEDENGIWLMYFGMNRVSDAFSIHSEAQFRYYETVGNFNQLLLRTGLNYHFAPRAIATVGYAFIDTDPTFGETGIPGGSFNGNEILEHRIFEQFIMTDAIGKVAFEHRYRLEQRFIRNTDLDEERVTRHRARYRLQVTVPLSQAVFLNFYDEIFVNLQDDLFDQNRLYGAVGYRFSPEVSVQAGYLKNQFRTGRFDRFQLALFFNPDFRKDERP